MAWAYRWVICLHDRSSISWWYVEISTVNVPATDLLFGAYVDGVCTSTLSVSIFSNLSMLSLNTGIWGGSSWCGAAGGDIPIQVTR